MQNIKQGYKRSFKYWFTPMSVAGGSYLAWQYSAGEYGDSLLVPLIFFGLGMLFATLVFIWFPENKTNGD